MVAEYVIIAALVILSIILYATAGRRARKMARKRVKAAEMDAQNKIEQARAEYDTKLADATAASYERLDETVTKLNTEHKAELEAAKTAAAESRTKSLVAQRGVIKGKAYEQLAPYLPGFEYNPSDTRFMGSPIDFIVFDGLRDEKAEVDVVIIDVKTGSSQLNSNQRRIKKAVEAKRVRFETIRQDGEKDAPVKGGLAQEQYGCTECGHVNTLEEEVHRMKTVVSAPCGGCGSTTWMKQVEEQ